MTSKLIVKVDSVGSSYCTHKVGDFFEVENDAISIPDGKHVCILVSVESLTLPMGMSESW